MLETDDFISSTFDNLEYTGILGRVRSDDICNLIYIIVI